MTAAAASLSRAAAELPLLVAATLLLSTGAGILPGDAIVGVGELQLDLSRLLILAGLVALVATEGVRGELFRARVGLPLALLVAVSLVATVKWGTWPRFRFLVEGVALFYLVFALLRARPEARNPLLLVGVVAFAIAGLTAIAQVSQSDATGFYRQGCVPVTDPSGIAPPDSITRAIGTFSNPNVLAGHLLLLAPLGLLAVAWLRPLTTIRLGAALVVGLGYLAIVLTLSRAAVLAALLALGVGVAASRLPHRRYLALVGVGAAIALSILFAGCGSEATASYGRTQEWSDTVEVARENPVYGVGLGRLGDVLHERDPRSTARHAHNLFLTWWAEAGTGALIAWIWLAALLLWRTLRGAGAGGAAARAGLVALAGFFAFSLLDHPANVDRVAIAFWVVAAFAAAAAAPPPRRRGAAREPERRELVTGPVPG